MARIEYNIQEIDLRRKESLRTMHFRAPKVLNVSRASRLDAGKDEVTNALERQLLRGSMPA